MRIVFLKVAELNLNKTMTKVIEFLRGKKTYIIGALMIALGLLQSDNNLVLEGLGLITLRAGVAKVSQ